MKIKKSLLFIVLFAMINQIAFAQNSIKGKVTDKSTKMALPFTNVYLPEQTKGTLTDKNGEFVITNIPKGELKIQFSYIGYKTIIKTFFTDKTETEIGRAHV